MEIKQFIKLCLSLIKRPKSTFYTLSLTRYSSIYDMRKNIQDGADWLLESQASAPDGDGYSRQFSLISGWDRCYIETTGYIIPTLFDVSSYLKDERYRESAIRAGKWLLTVQTGEGAFAEIDDYKPMVFDTGQVMLGLNRLYKELKDKRYLESAIKAAEWLVGIQEDDGSWIKFAYNARPHAYYSRVAAALIETGQLADNDKLIEAGIKQLDWVLAQEQENGYYKYSEFRPGEDALLHTLVYVMEGFSMAYDLTGLDRYKEALIRGTDALRYRLTENGLLYSQYDSQWRATNTEYCVTGLAQFAGICYNTFQHTKDPKYSETAEKVLSNLRRWQVTSGTDLAGALPSSIPVWGYYGGMSFFNWNTKFFIDACLKSLYIGVIK